MVAEVLGRAPAGDDPPQVRFGADGRLVGHTGVNRLTAAYEVREAAVTVGPLALTRMAGPADRMEIEHLLVQALATPLPVTGEGDDVRLGDPPRLLLRRAGAPAAS